MVYVFLADGFEEIEALTVVDVLRRAEIPVLSVGIGGSAIEGSHGITVSADIEIEAVETGEIEALVLPGGMPGTENLWKSARLRGILESAFKNGLHIFAICAAPIILGRLGFLKNRKATCFPGFEKELLGAEITPCGVCPDGNIITARGPGAALPFSYKIVEVFKGKKSAEQLRRAMQYE